MENAHSNEQHIENLLNNIAIQTINERENSSGKERFFHAFKKTWNKHKYLRLSAGVALSVGAILATSVGALPLAGGLLAGRAILGGVGGFISMDALFDILRSKLTKNEFEKFLIKLDTAEKLEDLKSEIEAIKNTYGAQSGGSIQEGVEMAKYTHAKMKKAKLATSLVAGAGIGAVLGNKATHALDVSKDITKTAVKGKVEGILQSVHVPGAKGTYNIREIFADIKHDHPNQHYVTIEQAVRRVVGLQKGIPLHESEHLNTMNASISKMVHDPHGSITKAARELGILKEGQSIHDVSRALTEDKIAKIIERAYPSTPSNLPTSPVSHISMAPPYIQEIPEKIITHPPVNTTPGMGLGNKIKLIGAGITTLVGGLFAGKKLFGKNKNSEVPTREQESVPQNRPNAPIHNTIQNIPPSSPTLPPRMPQEATQRTTIQTPTSRVLPTRPISPTNITPRTGGSDTTRGGQDDGDDTRTVPVAVPTHREDIEHTRPINFAEKIDNLIAIGKRFFGFDLEASTFTVDTNSFRGLMTKKTIGGEFAIEINGTNETQNMTIHWFDHGKGKFSKQVTVHLTDPQEGEYQRGVFAKMKELFTDALRTRDRIKNEEYRDNFHTVEISKGDIQKIFTQLDVPYVRDNGYETGGWWFQSIYGLNNGVLKMNNIQNPVVGVELEVTPVSTCTSDTRFMNRNMKHAIDTTFDNFEWTYLSRLSGNGNPEELSGKMFFFNWHKHPNAPICPSSGDLGELGEIGNFTKFSPLPIITFGIVVQKHAYFNRYGSLKSNAVIIKSDDPQKTGEYVMTYWKVKRREGAVNYNQNDLHPVSIQVVD